MPRALILLLVGLGTLLGCAAQTPAPLAGSMPTVVRPSPALERWVNLYSDVDKMESAQVVERLVEIDRPEGIGQLFYFGLLNQQLSNYTSWITARDTFNELESDETLGLPQRQLAGVMRQLNQDKINSYTKQSELAQQLTELQQRLQISDEEKVLLQHKIQALTELEADMSTRKEE